MRAFVTGGSGFVGRNLIGALRRLGHEVRGLGRSEAAQEAVRAAGAEPVAGDLGDEASLRAGMAGCDVVFHSAAMVEDTGDPAEFHRVNVGGTEHVLSAASAAGVSRLVHVSTEAVLVGGRPIVNADETWPRPARPLGLYPLTKGLAEERVLARSSRELTTVVVRPRLIWGRGDTTLLPHFVSAVKKGAFRWVGGGHYLTSTCHVENVCEGLILAAERGGGGEIYFLTDGPPVEFRAFLTALLMTQGVAPPGGSLPRPVARAAAWISEVAWRLLPLPGRPPISRTALKLIGEEVTVNDQKARRELGYVGKVSREAGLLAMRQG